MKFRDWGRGRTNLLASELLASRMTPDFSSGIALHYHNRVQQEHSPIQLEAVEEEEELGRRLLKKIQGYLWLIGLPPSWRDQLHWLLVSTNDII